MGVPAREDAMDAMVPCEVRAAANVNKTPWGVVLSNVDRTETRDSLLTTWRVSTNQNAGLFASRSEIFRVHRANSLRPMRRHDFVEQLVY